MEQVELPTSINILGTWVKIKIVKDIPTTPNDDEIIYGTFEYDTDTITIKKSSYAEMKRVLFHEATHAILSYSGLSEVITNEVEEGICCLSEYNAKLYDIGKTSFTKFKKRRKSK